MTTKEFESLKRDLEDLTRMRERDKGALEEFRKRIKEVFGRDLSRKEAVRIAAKLKDELQELDRVMEEKFAAFNRRWHDELAKAKE